MPQIIPFPTTTLEALALVARAEFGPDDIAEVGDNIIILRDGDEYTITEEPDDFDDVREALLTVKFEK